MTVSRSLGLPSLTANWPTVVALLVRREVSPSQPPACRSPVLQGITHQSPSGWSRGYSTSPSISPSSTIIADVGYDISVFCIYVPGTPHEHRSSCPLPRNSGLMRDTATNNLHAPPSAWNSSIHRCGASYLAASLGCGTALPTAHHFRRQPFHPTRIVGPAPAPED